MMSEHNTPLIKECWYWEHQLISGKVIDSGFSRDEVHETDNAFWGTHPEGKVYTVVTRLVPATSIQVTIADSELIAIYDKANGHEGGKLKPITTAKILTAMRACLSQQPSSDTQ